MIKKVSLFFSFLFFTSNIFCISEKSFKNLQKALSRETLIIINEQVNPWKGTEIAYLVDSIHFEQTTRELLVLENEENITFSSPINQNNTRQKIVWKAERVGPMTAEDNTSFPLFFFPVLQ